MKTSLALSSLVLLSLSQLATFASGSPLNSSISLVPSVSETPSATPTSCSNGARFTAINGDVYQAECNVDHSGGDLAQVYVPTFTDCLEACSQRDECIDVTYEGSICYMKYLSRTNRQGLLGAFRINKFFPGKGVPAKRDAYARNVYHLPLYRLPRTTTTRNVTESHVKTQSETSTVVARPTTKAHYALTKVTPPAVLTSTVSLKIEPRDLKTGAPAPQSLTHFNSTILLLGSPIGTVVSDSLVIGPKSATVATLVSGTLVLGSKTTTVDTKPVADATTTVIVTLPRSTTSSTFRSTLSLSESKSAASTPQTTSSTFRSTLSESKPANKTLIPITSGYLLMPVTTVTLSKAKSTSKARSKPAELEPRHTKSTLVAQVMTLTQLVNSKPKTNSSSTSAHPQSVQRAHVTTVTFLAGKNSTTSSHSYPPFRPAKTITAVSTTKTTSTSLKRTFTTITSSRSPTSTTTKYLVSRGAEVRGKCKSAERVGGHPLETADGATILEVRPSTTVTVTSVPPNHGFGGERYRIHHTPTD
ncbi:MAG: hypothetical protein Q9157_006768 [Trypethelium eluteriae]